MEIENLLRFESIWNEMDSKIGMESECLKKRVIESEYQKKRVSEREIESERSRKETKSK